MKKVAIGCGIVALLVIVVGGVGVYYVMHKFGSTMATFAALQSIPDIEQGIEDKAPYTPPSSGKFTDAQLSRFLAVQAVVREKLGSRFDALDQKYKTLSESLKQRDATVMDGPALLGAYSDLASAYLDAKRWQVDALNAQHLSLAEYRWIRKQAYAAIGVTVMNVDVGEIISEVRAGHNPQMEPPQLVAGPTGPEQNRTLADAHRKALEDNAALAFLGL